MLIHSVCRARLDPSVKMVHYDLKAVAKLSDAQYPVVMTRSIQGGGEIKHRVGHGDATSAAAMAIVSPMPVEHLGRSAESAQSLTMTEVVSPASSASSSASSPTFGGRVRKTGATLLNTTPPMGLIGTKNRA